MIKFTSLVAIAVLSVASLSADIAPTRYGGSGIVPQRETSLRMEKADVEIIWGTPCSLSATFLMANPSNASQELQIGFPMPQTARFQKRDAKQDLLSISFDNAEPAVVSPSSTTTDEEESMVWYHCTHTFKPGTTLVTVRAVLRASGSNINFHESLFYCIETGGRWAGSIGEETVTIRFPHPIEENQITHAAPAGFKIEGNSVRWHLVDIDPKGKEFDIHLTYLRPDAMRALAEIRQELARDPSSAALTIKLARNLFAFGVPKSNSGFPPSSLSKVEYRTILPKIANERHRQIFTQHYDVVGENTYGASNTEWTDERRKLIQILADAGYRDEESKSVVILEAETLIESLLKHEPHNAEAWNVYLANYWRISFAAVGHWFGSTHFSLAQIQAIETAAKNCPDDECIQGWLALIQTKGHGLDALHEKIKSAGYYRIDPPKPEYGYY